MTAPNQWTSDQLATLQGYVDAAKADSPAGHLKGARAAITQYYADQAAWGRDYPVLAGDVVTNTTFEGQVAVDTLQNIAGSSVTPATETQLLISLATSDNAIMQGNGGFWPVVAQIEAYHYQDYQALDLPVFAWGGAAFAYFDQNWGGGTLTSYEVGDGSHSALFQSMTAEQVQQNVDTLTYDGMLKIGIAAGFVRSAPAPSRRWPVRCARSRRRTDGWSRTTDGRERHARPDRRSPGR